MQAALISSVSRQKKENGDTVNRTLAKAVSLVRNSDGSRIAV